MIEFVCTKHKLNLDGWPTFTLVTSDPRDKFEICFNLMYCPRGDQECEESWVVEQDKSDILVTKKS